MSGFRDKARIELADAVLALPEWHIFRHLPDCPVQDGRKCPPNCNMGPVIAALSHLRALVDECPVCGGYPPGHSTSGADACYCKEPS